MTNPIDQTIMNRRSITNFKLDPVDIDEIIELLNIAKWAPNHHVNEPWRFLLFAEAGKEKFVQAFLDCASKVNGAPSPAALNKAEYFRDIPLHLVAVISEDPRQKQRDEDFGAVSSLLQNFQLAAWERGIGMIWRSNDWIYNPAFREALGVKPGEKIVATMMIGYPQTVPQKRDRTDIREKLTIIKE